ncbi:MAG: PLP-dependent aminotransferase family protein [Pseudomonadota bacterium]
MAIAPDSIFLDTADEGTLQAQIKRQIVSHILSGQFRSGERLPSSRALAKHLGISRITVTIAYSDLVADDYIEARGRSGYFVSATAPGEAAFAPNPTRSETSVDWVRFLGHRSASPETILRPKDWRNYRYPFIYGQTDAKLFDHKNWRLCAMQALGQKDFYTLASDYYTEDDPLLIDYIRRHILTRRGVSAPPETILITMGAQNALWLTAQLLLSQRRVAVVENPGYPGLREILATTRCHVAPVDVDAGGLPPQALPDTVDVVYTTVSHQSPTNVTMPMARRKELLRRASDEGFVIVEDDYEFELSFDNPPSPSLKSLDTDGTVIHVGSFSKSLFPGLRLGYLVAPAPFIKEARALRATVLRHPPGLTQRTAAYFLSLGHYASQINRIKSAYARRRAAMDRAIAEHGLTVAQGSGQGGSSLWMVAPSDIDTVDLALRLHAQGVVIEPGRPFFDADGSVPNTRYRLAYSSIPSARIPDGIALITAEISRSGRIGP